MSESWLAPPETDGVLVPLQADSIHPHVGALAQLSIHRMPIPPRLARAHALLGQIAAEDALYVALTLSVNGQLITTDERLRRAARGIVELA